jgi:DNA invertase Pin-like site-specific DNA recombinase
MTTIQRPWAIRPTHLERKAIVYVRQSSEAQVERHQGSTEYQRGQVDLAFSWGWPRDRIELVDCDLGLSGAATDHRLGYRKMVEEICSGRVGIVLISDFSRASRSALAWLSLLDNCRLNDVLLAINGTVHDLSDDDALFNSQVNALFGERDTNARRGHLQRGRIAKVKAGRTVTQPPAGYVRLPNASWIKDPDTAVREAVALVFRVFLERRSLRETVRRLKELGARLPRKHSGCPVHWVAPTVSAVQQILKNQSFAGAYVWGRRKSDPRLGRDRHGRVRTRMASSNERLVLPNHHEAYISMESWEHNQSILEENRWNGRHPGGLGRGRALLQGIIGCGLHRNRRMSPGYKSKRKDGTFSHSYCCIGDYHLGGPQCGHRPGTPIDAKVVEGVFAHLTPPSIEVVCEEWRKARADALSEERRKRTELRRAEEDVEQLWARYMTIDPENRRVRVEVERRIEEAKCRVEKLRENADSGASALDMFDEKTLEELLLLSQDVPSLWTVETTTDRDRKELLRALIEFVVVERFDRETIDLTIRWLAGWPVTKTRVMLPPYAHNLIRAWATEGATADTIAIRLQDANVKTKYGTPWTSRAVRRALARMTGDDHQKARVMPSSA